MPVTGCFVLCVSKSVCILCVCACVWTHRGLEVAESFPELLLSYPVAASARAESQKSSSGSSENSLCDSKRVIHLSGPLHLKNEVVALDYQ